MSVSRTKALTIESGTYIMNLPVYGATSYTYIGEQTVETFSIHDIKLC